MKINFLLPFIETKRIAEKIFLVFMIMIIFIRMGDVISYDTIGGESFCGEIHKWLLEGFS